MITYSGEDVNTHYSHNVDVTDEDRAFCSDCDVEISNPANNKGIKKQLERDLGNENKS